MYAIFVKLTTNNDDGTLFQLIKWKWKLKVYVSHFFFKLFKKVNIIFSKIWARSINGDTSPVYLYWIQIHDKLC